MTPFIKNDLVRIIKDSIAATLDIRKIFLFGSYAYGTPGPSSDLDLCFVTGRRPERKLELMRAIRRELSKHIDAPMDILVYEESEFNERASVDCTIEHFIASRGVAIYG